MIEFLIQYTQCTIPLPVVQNTLLITRMYTVLVFVHSVGLLPRLGDMEYFINHTDPE